MRRDNPLLFHQLTFTELLIVVAILARALLLRGIGSIMDYQWLCICESWLEVLGIRLPHVVQEEERAA